MVGSFLPGRIEVSYERYISSCGCLTYRFDTTTTLDRSSVFHYGKAFVKRLSRTWLRDRLNHRLLKVHKKLKPDLSIVFKGEDIYPQTIKFLSNLKNRSIFCFHADDPFNLSPGISNENIVASIPHYDCYFMWTTSLIPILYAHGAKKVEHLPFGYDPEYHRILSLSQRDVCTYGSDVVFVGNWDKERERWLRRLSCFNTGVWGEGYWRDRCRSKDVQKMWKRKAVYEIEMSKVLNASKVSLNMLRQQNKARHNMRTFESPACGAFTLAERSDEQKAYFDEDAEMVYYSSQEELADKIQYYLKHEAIRERIAHNGYERCASSGYSYLHRAKKILEVYHLMNTL